MPARRAQERPVEEIGGQLPLGQFYPDRGRARPVGIGRRFDPAQTVSEYPAQRADLEPQRLSLGRQLQAQLLAIISHAVFEA